MASDKTNDKPTIMLHLFHLYRGRFLFLEDDLVGKFDYLKRTLRIFKEHENIADHAVAFFRAKQSTNPRLLIGDEEPEADKPPILLPDEVAALGTPELGCRTPAVMRWAAENWPRETFVEFYGHEPPDFAEAPVIDVEIESEGDAGIPATDEPEAAPESEPEQPQPKRRGRRKKGE